MSQPDSKANKISQIFLKYSQEKKYQADHSEDDNGDCRIEISNLRERTIIIIYHTGKIVMGGKKNSLQAEFNELKQKFENNPQSFLEDAKQEVKNCAVRYDIMLSVLRTQIKEALNTLGAVEFTEGCDASIEYRARITRSGLVLTVTQYKNGTLFLQGRTDKLFNDNCDLIEQTANPSDKEVISRFISCDEENLINFTAKYTPELINVAENNVKLKIGVVFDYLDPYDKKWFVASECLCLTAIPLPEFSPLVMPASKAFEGFTKKLIVSIGLVDPGHFRTQKNNFSPLNDERNPKRMLICQRENHVHSMLKKVALCLDMSRNFMMHSDDSKVTKVESQEKAEEKVNSIFKDTKEIFDYFNDLFNLLPK